MDTDSEEKADQSVYFAAWYAKNRGSVAARRKKRYRTDPEYRESVHARNAAYRERQRGGKPPTAHWARAEAKTARKTGRRLLPRLLRLRGEDVVCYTNGVLLDAIRITLATLVVWHDKGIIPPPTSRDTMGRRWYSVEYIACLADCVRAAREGGWSNAQFTEAVAAAFHPRKGEPNAGNSKRKRIAPPHRHDQK